MAASRYVSSKKTFVLLLVAVLGLVFLYQRRVSHSTVRNNHNNQNAHYSTAEDSLLLQVGNDDSEMPSAENKNTAINQEISVQINQENKNIDKANEAKTPEVEEKLLAPLDDFVKYPCVPGIPMFPTSSWSIRGKCVRMFNNTKRARELKNECVSLITSKGTTPICIYDTVKDRFISGLLKKTGQWEGEFVENTLEMLTKHPSAYFLDLGCNIGTFSLAAASFGRHVIAVDAVIENLELLSKSLSLGKLHDNVTLIWNAISDEYSRVTLTKHKGNVAATKIRDLIKDDLENKETFITRTIKLDDLVPLLQGKTVVMKMDIETKEYSALLGGTRFFEAINVVMIQMEIKSHRTTEIGPKIVDYLAARNLTAFADLRKQRQLNVSTILTWPWDVYFLKP